MATGVYTRDSRLRMPASDIAAALAEIPFFASVDARQCARLAELCPQVPLEPDQVLFEAGSHGNAMYVLLSGALVIDLPAGFSHADRPEDAQSTSEVRVGLRTLRRDGGASGPAGAEQTWCGEGVALGQTVRPYGARAVEPSLVLEIDRVRLRRLASLAGPTLLAEIRAAVSSQTVELFLLGHRAFAAADRRVTRALSANGTVVSADRGGTVFEQGASARTVLMVRSGVVKLVRALRGSERTLAFYGPGDIVGTHDGLRRPGALIAMQPAELIEIPRKIFDEAVGRVERTQPGWREQFRRTADLDEGAEVEVARGTVTLFVDEIVGDSAQQAQSLMTINLDTCIRCGNCVRACEARHGHAKMVRRGKKLNRRYEAPSGRPVHEQIMLTSSCRHCESPECMIGCPTGAIHRKATGEVAIHDFCIGCSNCAMRCPWDNITMRPLDELIQRDDFGIMVDRIASKCDLCFGYTEANCVHNCPTEAILRVNPTTYFPEVRERVGARAGGDGGRTLEAAGPGRGRVLMWLAGLVVAGGATAAWQLEPRYVPAGSLGVGLGVAAAACLLGAASLAVRRRIAHRGRIRPPDGAEASAAAVDAERTRRAEAHARGEAIPDTGAPQLGAFHWWAKSHLVLGSVGLWLAFLHADFGAQSVLTQLLIALLGFDLLTGLFGVGFSRWMPRVMTRLEGESSQLEEDVVEERRKVDRELSALVDAHPGPEGEALRARLLGVPWLPFLRSDDAAREERRTAVAERVTEVLPRVSASMVDRAVRAATRRAELRAVSALYQTRRVWLGLHIGTTAGLLVALLVHVASVLPFLGLVP